MKIAFLLGTLLGTLIYGSTSVAQYGQQPRYGNAYGGDNNSMKIYDKEGSFRGNLNDNPYDPNSVSNPYGQYGSKYSPDSINNPYGAGNPYGN
ncbi:MAG: hypothetical protein K2X29_11155 [Candidatus Obscuribacterales bacterium]|nr:hypothetical protein [Candidatus Obscuribacterales bacterium]